VPAECPGSVAAHRRNPRIARLMRLIGYAEQVGTGMATIVRTWRAVDRTPTVVVSDPGRKTHGLPLRPARVPLHNDAFCKARVGASVSSDEARLLAWLHEVGAAPQVTARPFFGERHSLVCQHPDAPRALLGACRSAFGEGVRSPYRSADSQAPSRTLSLRLVLASLRARHVHRLATDSPHRGVVARIQRATLWVYTTLRHPWLRVLETNSIAGR